MTTPDHDATPDLVGALGASLAAPDGRCCYCGADIAGTAWVRAHDGRARCTEDACRRADASAYQRQRDRARAPAPGAPKKFKARPNSPVV